MQNRPDEAAGADWDGFVWFDAEGFGIESEGDWKDAAAAAGVPD
jgi:hypothetical protein